MVSATAVMALTQYLLLPRQSPNAAAAVLLVRPSKLSTSPTRAETHFSSAAPPLHAELNLVTCGTRGMAACPTARISVMQSPALVAFSISLASVSLCVVVCADGLC